MKFFNTYDERGVIAMPFLLIVLTEKSKKTSVFDSSDVKSW